MVNRVSLSVGFPDSSVGKESPAMQETLVQFLDREDPLEKYSGLENSVDCIVHGVAKSRTQLSNFHFQL